MQDGCNIWGMVPVPFGAVAGTVPPSLDDRDGKMTSEDDDALVFNTPFDWAMLNTRVDVLRWTSSPEVSEGEQQPAMLHISSYSDRKTSPLFAIGMDVSYFAGKKGVGRLLGL
jgi:hypothetical protein